jgi:Leucine-rich repeat (LRR) protein
MKFSYYFQLCNLPICYNRQWQKRMKENPLRRNFEIEGGTKNQTHTLARTCCVLWSCESVLISSLVLSIACGEFYIFLTLTQLRISFTREGVWVFFALGSLSCLLVVWFIVRTCTVVLRDSKAKEKKLPTSIATAIALYNSAFDVDGKYYLTKLYFSELFEHAQQVYSLTEIYLCLMPVNISSTVCTVLIIELSINIWATFRISSQEVRNRLILLDTVTDLFCLAFPLLYAWISFRLPVRINELYLIVVYPTLSVLSKLNDIWEEYFNIEVERAKRQKMTQRRSRRTSILNLSHNQKIYDMQLKHFPNWLRYSFTVLNIGFLLFFATLAGVHLSTQPSAKKCAGIFTEEVWEACRVPVPFCQDLFVAKCDCSVLEMFNYTHKKLPDSFEGLLSLAKIGVYNGALEELPKHIGGNHKRLLVLDVTGNNIEQLPDSVGELEGLNMLIVSSNRLKSLPDNVGRLKNLVNLYASNNQLESLPESVGELKGLLYLFAYNNRLRSLPDSVGKLERLIKLFVYNNQLQSLPGSVGKLQKMLKLSIYNNQLQSLPDSTEKLHNLVEVLAWNNSLTSLPKMVGTMKSLNHVDVRWNNLGHLPSSVSKWDKIKYLYLEGNPLCIDLNIPSNLKGANGLCEQQCSMDCPDNWLGSGACDDNHNTYHYTKNIDPSIKPKPNSGCNTLACEYDKGDCPR